MDGSKLTRAQKYELYKKGHYLLVPPPVPTQGWTIEDWIRWIDLKNGWLINKGGDTHDING